MRYLLTLAGLLAFSISGFDLRAESPLPDSVELLRIESMRMFPEATEPGAIQYACASSPLALQTYYASRGLPFERDLVRKYKDRNHCHIHYEPTIPGFRTLTDDRPITGLISGIHPNDFVIDRRPSGESMSVVQFVLERIPQSLDVTLSIVEDYGDHLWPAALERHFPNTRHRIRLIHSSAEDTHPWGQDYVKAGEVDGKLQLLTTRRLYEGRAEDGDRFLPLLDAFQDGPYVRSKLSWEGGDLQVVRDPRNPSQRILFYGSTVRDYWGAELRPREFGWILRVEFGADSAFDLSHIGPHTDYLVAFPPEGGLALVSKPVRDDFTLARSAAAELQKMYGSRAPKEIRALPGVLSRLETGGGETAHSDLLRLIDGLREILPAIAPYVDPKTDAELIAHLEGSCKDDIYGCFNAEGRRRLLQTDPDLLRRTLNLKVDQEAEERGHWQLLNLIESQLPIDAPRMDKQLDRVAEGLKDRGFRIVRVPYLYSDRQTKGWPGVSYVNLLAVGKQLFPPAYGLGKAEEAFFKQMRNRLPGYEVTPVPARMGVASNGGIHCVFGIIRKP